MTRNTTLIAGLGLFLLALCAPTLLFAEKAPEQKDAADHVLTAEVVGVYSRTVEFENAGEQRERIEYVIELDVKAVHRGKHVKAGERFYAHCFDVVPINDPTFDPPKRGIIGMNGHFGLPKEGQTIKAYTRLEYGTNNGLYPEWFEVIEDKKNGDDE